MSKNIYIFSGLGADERIFQRLDLSGFSITFIKWILPQDNETIEQYASRLLEQIPAKQPTFIGLSFGGLIAVEIAKQIDTEQIILISSAKTRNEIPYYYRWVGQLGFHRLLPARLLKKSNFVSNWFFGTTSDFDNQLLKTILNDTDPIFLRWAIDTVVKWKNQIRHKNIKQIHGTKDRILPFRFITCDFKVEKGGHLMTLNKSDKITQTIRDLLQ